MQINLNNTKKELTPEEKFLNMKIGDIAEIPYFDEVNSSVKKYDYYLLIKTDIINNNQFALLNLNSNTIDFAGPSKKRIFSDLCGIGMIQEEIYIYKSEDTKLIINYSCE